MLVTQRFRKSMRPGGVASPVGVFCGSAVVGAFIVVLLFELVFAVTEQTALFVAIGVGLYLFGVGVAAVFLYRDFPHRSLGWCNLVTLARLVIVSVIAAAVMAGFAPNWALFALAVVSLCLDGVDGWLARTQGLASDFGARFDVEVDALFALVLALYAAANGAVGPYVLLLGLPHYLFWVARMLLPWLNQPLPPSFARKAVCVFQIGALIALLLPFMEKGAASVVVILVVVALVMSFGRDILWLWRLQRAPA